MSQVERGVPRGLVIVTGADGFVGTALCAHLRGQGHPRIGAVRSMRRNLPGDLQPVGDLALADEARLDDLVGGADAVVHLAGRAHRMKAKIGDSRLHQVANAELTARVARAALRGGVKRFVLASTIKVNGEFSVHAFRPEDIPHPEDAYARSKLAAERELLDLCSSGSMTPMILRLPLIYGRGARGNFPKLVEAVRARRRLPLAWVQNRRSLLYLGNLVEAIEATLVCPVAPAGVHFVTDSEAVSTPDLIRAIAAAWKVKPRLYGVPVPILRMAAGLVGKGAVIARLVDSLEGDSASFRAATGWSPRWPLDAALLRTASVHRSAPLF